MEENDTIISSDSTNVSFLPEVPKIDAHEFAASVKEFVSSQLVNDIPFKGEPIASNYYNWQLGILLGLLICFSIIRLGYINRYHQLLESFGSIRYMRQAIREELSLAHPFSLFLLINFAFNLALLLVMIFDYYTIQLLAIESWLMCLIVAMATLVLLFSKSIFLKIIQFIIGTDAGQTENRYSMLVFNQVLGLLLLPISIFACFGPENYRISTCFIGLSLVALFLVIRIMRGIFIGFNQGAGILHIILYLCALELTPLVVMIKLLMLEIG